ncbi:unnamed protein product, partial [Phaeothamnion confervicola]
RKWRSGRGAEYRDAAEAHATGARRRRYAEDELQEAYGRYAARRDGEEAARLAARWVALFALRRLLARSLSTAAKPPSVVRLAGGDRALYERIFRAEPRKYINKPLFLTTMRRVFGLGLA